MHLGDYLAEGRDLRWYLGIKFLVVRNLGNNLADI